MERLELTIKYFKSIKELTITLNKFNLLVGPNGSGKTNIVEAIELFKDCISNYDEYRGRESTKITKSIDEDTTFNKWWGYENAVWRRDKDKSIELSCKYYYDSKYNSYTAKIRGKDDGSIIFVRTVDNADKVLIPLGAQNAASNPAYKPQGDWTTMLSDNCYKPSTINVPVGSTITWVNNDTASHTVTYASNPLDASTWDLDGKILAGMRLIAPNQSFTWTFEKEGVYPYFCVVHPWEIGRVIVEGQRLRGAVANIILNTLILKDINYKKMKEAISISKSKELLSDGSNLANVLHNLYLEDRDAIEYIERVLNIIFDRKIRIIPKLTSDNRVYITINEDGLKLNPHMISDGMLKLLLILTAIALRPSILVIDEIENSIYPKAIEFIVGELKDSDIITIVTTHSPIVVDIVDLEDLIFVERDENGDTIARRVSNVSEIKEKLNKYRITLSEGWLYGNL